MAEDLDDVLDSPLDQGSLDYGTEPEPKEADEPQEAAEAVPDQEAPADETGEESGEKDDVEAPPAQPDMVPLAALQDERDRRQSAEQRAQQMQEQQMEALRQQNRQLAQQQTKADQEEMFEDPDAYERKLIEQRIMQTVDDRMFNALSNMSVYQAQQRHEDYGEKEQLFSKLAEANPALVGQMRSHPDPAEFAYQTAAQYLLLQEVGKDPAAYEASMREKIKAELLAEQAETQKTPSSGKREAPPTLVNERSSQNSREPAWAGPEPLDTLFPDYG